ncbi:MAG: hypothetical protein J2P28_12070, partial [Actinobacteria bacterium]|nr:hypothetical protein [Actinomycetota bacterium]
MAASVNDCNGRYPPFQGVWQCTAGAAGIFPAVCSAPNLGNGGDWYGVAAGLGWPHQQGQAVPGWLASFNVDPPYGDVGLVEAVNGDQLLRNGVNWHLNGQWSRDWVAVDLVRGSFLPPGPFVPPPNYQGPTPAQTLAATPGGQGAGPAPA